MNPLFPAYNGWCESEPLTVGLCLGVVVTFLALMRSAAFRRIFFILIFIGLLGFGMRYHRSVGRMFFPLPYRSTIYGQAKVNRVDPRLVAAVIYVESGFRPEAISPKGAIGLMQVMPETGRWVGQQMRMEITPETLRNTEINIQAGTWYLRYLLDLMEQDHILTLAAYNAGWNRTQGWIRDGVWNGRLSGLHQVPYPETRRYVAKVLRMYRIYRYLYDL